MCSHLSSALSKFKCLAAKHLCLNPLWYYFLVTCPRLDPNDDITGRGCAWMSLEETVVVLIQYVVGCLYTDIAKTSTGNFRQVRTAFSGELPQARTILLFGSYSGTFLHVEIFWLVTKVIPSLHVILLAVRDRQWNELPEEFKITWRHSNQPITWRP